MQARQAMGGSSGAASLRVSGYTSQRGRKRTRSVCSVRVQGDTIRRCTILGTSLIRLVRLVRLIRLVRLVRLASTSVIVPRRHFPRPVR
jgi:hypothetical protein